jgi:putative adenylate-forming enzyme
LRFKLKILYYLIELRLNRKKYAKNISALQAKHWERLQDILKKSNFYRELANQNKTLADYPIVNKQIFMDKFDEINTCKIKLEDAYKIALEAEKSRDFSPMIKGISIGLSTGTSGNRSLFLVSEDERAKWVSAVLDRVIGFSLKKRSVAFFLRANSNLYDSVKSKTLRFEFFDLLKNLSSHVKRLNSLQPNILVAQPSMLLLLANEQKTGRLKIKPEKIIGVAEVLYEEDCNYLEEDFEQIIHQVYQCTEGFLASTCSQGTLHFHEDFLIIEKKYINDEKSRFHPIITDLSRSSQPVIRYELYDIVQEKKDCNCGSKWIGIESIEGRSDDIIKLKSITGGTVNLFPDFLRRAIVTASEDIRSYGLICIGENELELFVEGSAQQFELAKKNIMNLLKSLDIQNTTISQITSTKVEKGNKLRRIRNERS